MLALIPGQIHLALISGKIHIKILRALPGFGRPCRLFCLQSPAKFIVALISGQIQSRNSRASASLPSAMLFKLATYIVHLQSNLVGQKASKIETLYVAGVGCARLVSRLFLILKNCVDIFYNHIILYLQIYI